MGIDVDSIDNLTIVNSVLKTRNILNGHRSAVVNISGGADSDIMLDLLETCGDTRCEKRYVFIDTGLEYDATKKHIDYLEDKYGITIDRVRSNKSIPYCVNRYGYPFVNKRVSEMIHRLQLHDFKFEDRPYSELIKEYPTCASALKWWCNENKEGGCFNIDNNKWLKEFLIDNPPVDIKISHRCCTHAKKNTTERFCGSGVYDLQCLGVRKYEGGARTSIKSCFLTNSEDIDKFLPIFWYTDGDKSQYDSEMGIVHSDCYSVYGMKRTGCAGCPFGRDFEKELELIQKYEPKLYNACVKIFGRSYEYTKAYREYYKKKEDIEQSSTS